MIQYPNFEIFAFFFIYLVTKFLCTIVKKNQMSMFNKQETLSSIPEKDESDEEIVKWVPKKKHEVLKAKYKCLKKLFQIYDASVIGILPQAEPIHLEEQRTHRRRRSHRTKTDACAGTTEESNGDALEHQRSVAEIVIKDLKLVKSDSRKDESTQDSAEDLTIGSERSYQNVRLPYPYIKRGKRPTRFQIFLQRILGIKQERYGHELPNDRMYPSSEINIANRCEKRRRRALRFRRVRRAKKIYSELDLGDLQSPTIMTFVQSIQRSCLMDTTQRHCPIAGCKMIWNGIINYNDHLNLCHFPDRKYICHYCHEGFSKESDKAVHENEHLGITKINATVTSMPSTPRLSTKTEINTQTELEAPKPQVPEEKLKKIVSFFDKIDTSRMNDTKKNQCSESILRTIHRNSKIGTDSRITTDCSESRKSSDSGNMMNSDVALRGKNWTTSDSKNFSRYSSVRCQLCGEGFDYRRQLSLHVDLEHKMHDKFSKFHSCAGIVNKVKETASTPATDIEPATDSNQTLTYDLSTNIIYTSTESIDECAKLENKFMYKWQPETKIIHI